MSPTNVDARTYGNKNLSLTVSIRQKPRLSPIANKPRHLPNLIRNASTAAKIHAVANAEIINVPI
jgi:hypothetical protein